jgi:formylglycine-generating enzyme
MELFMSAYRFSIIRAAAIVVGLMGSAASADVFNLGGVRNPQTGQWTGVASLEMVPVGNAGNAADTTGFGAVGYNYNIGKYDVTAGQYTAFLNAVAATDTYSLYDAQMANACGISQTPNGSGGYTYATTKNPNFPVNWVTFWDACRFTNWLQNGQPTNVGQVAGTTETGAYDLTAPGAISDNTATRTAGATWAVTSEDEWHKAAYFDPTLSGGAGGYWLYPTRSNSDPTNVLSATGTNNANYYDFGGTGTGGYTDGVNHLTPVGAFAASPGPFGTYDQGGDLWQWNDTIINGGLRGQRGASYVDPVRKLQSSHRDFTYPWYSTAGDVGFRVVQLVPEPASLVILGFGAMALLRRRHRRKV